jgi:hypothetical protein
MQRFGCSPICAVIASPMCVSDVCTDVIVNGLAINQEPVKITLVVTDIRAATAVRPEPVSGVLADTRSDS